MNWSHGHVVTRSRDHKMVRRSKFQLPFHVMWWIQTFDLGVGDNLICFPVYHIYFFVGKGQSLYPNWRCWIFLPPQSATVSSTIRWNLREKSGTKLLT